MPDDPLYGRYVVLNTPRGPIEVGCRIEAKDFKSGFICLLCLERRVPKPTPEFEKKEDLIEHIEKEHPDLIYILECFTKTAPSQAKMII